MSTLTFCLSPAQSNLPKEDKDYIRERSKEYQETDKLSAVEAHMKAVEDVLSEYTAEHKAIVDQVESAGGVVPESWVLSQPLTEKKAEPTQVVEVKEKAVVKKPDEVSDKEAKPEKKPLYSKKKTEDITKTTAFKDWFGDSKVVNESGEPLVVYHGTSKDIEAFRGVTWGSKTPELANEYAEYRGYAQGGGENVIPVYMRINNMFDADAMPKTVTIGSFFNGALDQAKKDGRELNNDDKAKAKVLLQEIKSAAQTEESGPHYDRHNFWNAPSMLFGRDGAKSIESLFDILGFDGVRMTEHGSITYGAFTPSQVKSVHNIGTFDPTDPHILYKKEAVKPKPQSTTKQLTDTLLSGKYKGPVKKMLDQGKLKIVQSESALPSGSNPLYMTAYHGTPHDFDQFTLDHIGSGEGAQAYGYGLYFAESRGVAEWYRDQLSESKIKYKGEALKIKGGRGVISTRLTDSEKFAIESLIESGLDTEKAKKRINELIPSDWGGFVRKYNRLAENKSMSTFSSFIRFGNRGKNYQLLRDRFSAKEEAINSLDEVKVNLEKSGTIFKVELAPSEDEYLLWDKPLSEQSEKVQGAIKSWVDGYEKTNGISKRFVTDKIHNGANGSHIYNVLRDVYRLQKTASDNLLSLGIRGIKYFDGTSRTEQEGTFNYVIFSDEDISITAKYSKSGGVAGAYLAQDDTIYVVADNVPTGDVESVMLHEGFHSRWRDVLGKTQADRLEKSFDRLSKLKTNAEWIKKAKAAVPADTPAEYVTEEIFAYSVEKYQTSPDTLPARIKRWVQDFLAKLKLGLIRMGMKPKDITPADLNAIAQSSLKMFAETEVVGEAVPAFSKIKQASKTSSAAFKKWFGDSKVVDESGNPLVVYHGTGASFESFDTKRGEFGDLGSHFGTSKAAYEAGEIYRHGREDTGIVYPAFLSIKNPLKMRDMEFWEFDKIAAELNKTNPEIEIKESKFLGEVFYRKEDVVTAIKDAGYDGIVYKNEHEDKGSTSYIAFDPEQIKSQFNLGAFDPVDPRILYSKRKTEFTKEEQEAIEVGGFGIREKSTTKEAWDNLKDRFSTKMRQGIVDQYASIKEILKDDRAWMMAHLSHASTGGLEAVMQFGQPKLTDGALDVDIKKKSLQEILEPLGDDLDRFFMWMVGNRAAKLKAEDREQLFSNVNIKALQGMDKTSSVGPEVFESVRKDFEVMGDAINQIAVETGLVSKAEAKAWMEESFYVPFYRMLEGETRGPRMFADQLTKQTAYKKLKGSKLQLDDPLTNVLLNWQHLLSASTKNQAAVHAIDAAQKMDLATKVPEKAKHSKDAIWVRRDGKQVWYEIAEGTNGALVLDSLMSLNYDGMNNLAMKALRSFKRALTIGVTLSPEFRVANLLRDSIHSIAVVGDEGMSTNIGKNILNGWEDTKKGSPLHARMIASGGAFGDSGYIHGADPEAIKHVVMKGVKRDTILDARWRVTKMFDMYQDFGARMENVNRAAQFDKKLKDGDLLEAAFSSRDLLDFSRTGAFPAVRFLASAVPFLNARLQGLDKMGRAAMTKGERRRFATVVAMYSLASVALYLAMKDDEDYKESEEWEKDAYHLFKLPGSDVMYRLPRPFEVGAIANLAERAVEQVVNDDVHGELFAERLWHTINHTFAFNPMPQAFMPALEVFANKSTFTGRPIESQSMANLPAKERKRAWTSETAIALSHGMDDISWGKVVLSPVQIQHLVNGYLGWAGAQTLGAVDMLVTRPAIGAPERPAKKLTEYPLLKRFMRETPSRNTKYTTKFYEDLQEIRLAYNSVRQAKKLRELDKAISLRKEHKLKLKWRKAYSAAQRQLSKLNRRIEVIHRSSKTPELKRTEIDKLIARKNAITKKITEKADIR